MSIGIAVTLPDGALLVADSRRTWPQAEDKHPQDGVDKLVRISSTIFMIPFGAVQATDWALLHLRKNAAVDCTPDQFRLQLEASLMFGWDLFVGSLAPDVDRAHPTMRAALIAGGLAAQVPFIAGCLRGSGLPPSSELRKGPRPNVIVLGGEKQQAQELFMEKVRQRIRKWEYCAGPTSLLITLLLEAAVDVVKSVEAQDMSVGGSIRYVVVREGLPAKKAVWSG